MPSGVLGRVQERVVDGVPTGVLEGASPKKVQVDVLGRVLERVRAGMFDGNLAYRWVPIVPGGGARGGM